MLDKNLLIKPSATIKDALNQFTRMGKGCLIVVDKKNKLLGSVTDGDIRRVILKGKFLKDNIKDIYERNPIYLKKGKYSSDKTKGLFLKKRIDIIPVVDDFKKVIDLLIFTDLFKKNNLQQKKMSKTLIIMAGGKGTRLEPFTNVLPKPLIPINEKTVIEHIIEKFLKNNVSNFVITLNYKSKILKAFFDEMKPKFNVSFIDEPKPLGTAGGLSLLTGKIKKPFLVTNCDTIININTDDLLNFHNTNKNDLTLVASAKEFVIPYGTCKLNTKGYLQNILEKPKFDFLVSIGLYVINPNVTKLIPKNKAFDMIDLIQLAKRKKKQVGVYPIDDESWIDVGQWSEYRTAVDRLI